MSGAEQRLKAIRAALRRQANPAKANILQRFFKTGPGEYGEGDRFVGATVPQIRALAKTSAELPLSQVDRLLHSPIHEERLLGLLILVRRYEGGASAEREAVFDFYCRRLRRANNWDLIDLSVSKIIGAHLLNRDRSLLYQLAASADLWERRAAIVATYAFLRQGEIDDTLALAEKLLRDESDLLHKACGWMLREAWKRKPRPVEQFLRRRAAAMPRTMLRYAIERLPEKRRRAFLAIKKTS